MRTRYEYEKEEYTSFLKNVKAEREESSNFAKSLLGLVILTCLFLGVMYWICQQDGYVSKQKKTQTLKVKTKHSKNFNKPSAKSLGVPMFSKTKNILLLGVDSNGDDTDKWEGTRTDTIILMNVDPHARTINAISIPRDSKVYIGDSGIDKINSAHAVGGIKLTKKTIEDTLGIKIDNYIMVHDEVVEELVDALGGLPIYIEKNMDYDDYTAKLHIHLKKGMNTLNGRQTVGYLRFRKDGLGDIGRTRRQQWFLKGLLDEIKTPKTIGKLPDLLNVARANVKTDMSVYELSQLANTARGLDTGSVQIATLPGAPNQNGYISYWILDPEQVQDVIDRFIYHESPPIASNTTISAGIMYLPSKVQQAELIKYKLSEMGLKVNMMEASDLPHSQFIAFNKNVSNGLYNYIIKRISLINNIQFGYDPLKNYCVVSDFTIILSN